MSDRKVLPTDDLNLLGKDPLIALARRACATGDLLLTGQCLAAANARRLRTFRSVAAALFPQRKLDPIARLDEAQVITRSINKTTAGGHHVYVILLDGFAAKSRYGFYVGESRYRPENRATQHFAGIYAAGSARRMGLCLMPSLYEHLNPLSRTEAKQIEAELADKLREAGFNIRGGH